MENVKILNTYINFSLSFCFSQQGVFQVTPLDADEWLTVMKLSIPVVLLDELLKFIARRISDGKSYIKTCHGLVLAWAIFFIIIIWGPL